MRALLLSLALCCLVQFATPQTVVYTLSDVGPNDITYTIRSAIADINFANGDPCGASSERIAVWESEDAYKDFIEAMIAEPVTDGIVIMTGIGTADGDAHARTYNGYRRAPYVNFWDASTVYEIIPLTGADYCARLTFDSTAYDNFHNSRWHFGPLVLTSGNHFVCMDAADPDCSGDDCPVTRSDTRQDDKSCFWRPKGRCLFSWKEAQDVCYDYGGHLMNLIDDEDIDRIKDWTKDDPTWINLWLGLKQLPGDGHPTWWNGENVDEQSAWESSINYGSSSNYYPYAGVWHRATGAMNLYEVANSDGIEYKAFATCEATKEHYCKYRSKDVKHAEKSVCCDYEKLRYTCKPGFEFPDGDLEKEVDCGCSEDWDDASHYVPDCILKNPCKADDAHYCEPHGTCIFTNQYQKPYYCQCKPGFEWDYGGHNCVDINECLHNPCGHYHGHCMNTEGSYWCTCNKGWSWDGGYCSENNNPTPPPVVAVHTMTIYFHVNMNYDPHMNDPNTNDYQHFRDALDYLAEHAFYGERITVDSFEVSEETYGKMRVKCTFNLYIAADVTAVSKYVWKFYKYIKNADYFTVNSNTYPYYGSVSFQSSTVYKEIAITSACSIFDSIGQCHGSYCQADDYTPKCHCRQGYYGQFCNEHDGKPEGPWSGLTDTEIGLIIAVCVLFLLVICMPCCLLCCILHCRCFQNRRRVHHHDHEVYTNNPYSQSPTYVSKTTKVATRYPKFRIV